jgi:hypothetical protein
LFTGLASASEVVELDTRPILSADIEFRHGPLGLRFVVTVLALSAFNPIPDRRYEALVDECHSLNNENVQFFL